MKRKAIIAGILAVLLILCVLPFAAAQTRGDADGVIARVGNVFEQVLPEDFAQVFAIKRAMLAAGAEAAAMTGSGPTVFGLFRDKAAAEAAHSAIAFPGAQVFLTEFV